MLFNERLPKIALFLVILSYTCRSYLRTLDWQIEQKLFRTGLRVCPMNGKVHYNIAKKAADDGDMKVAVQEYNVAIALHQDYEHALNNLGNVYRCDIYTIKRSNIVSRILSCVNQVIFCLLLFFQAPTQIFGCPESP